MKIAVIIAEYNPFHNGHAYHIEQTRRMGATHVAVVMSGNFVQRGEPAFLEKRRRGRSGASGWSRPDRGTAAALCLRTSRRFARGAVALADGLGCAELLSFGSECGDLELLRHTAAVCDSPSFRQALKAELAQGRSYAAAQQRALSALGEQDAAAVLERPNDTLALEYLRALRTQGSRIRPVAVPRLFAEHDSPAPAVGSSFASASALRSMADTGMEQLSCYVPPAALSLYREAEACGELPVPHRTDLVLLTLLRSLPEEAFSRLPDCSEGVENRLLRARINALDTRGLLDSAKTRRYTHARLRRLVLAAALGIRREHTEGLPPYLRILGANTRGTEILAAGRKDARLPISHSLSRLEDMGGMIGETARLEARSTALYNLMLRIPRGSGTDYTDAAAWFR